MACGRSTCAAVGSAGGGRAQTVGTTITFTSVCNLSDPAHPAACSERSASGTRAWPERRASGSGSERS